MEKNLRISLTSITFQFMLLSPNSTLPNNSTFPGKFSFLFYSITILYLLSSEISSTPSTCLSADDLASYFIDKIDAIRWNCLIFPISNLPAYLHPTCLAFYLIKMKEVSPFPSKALPSQFCEEMRKLDSSECIASIQFLTIARLPSVRLLMWMQSWGRVIIQR